MTDGTTSRPPRERPYLLPPGMNPVRTYELIMKCRHREWLSAGRTLSAERRLFYAGWEDAYWRLISDEDKEVVCRSYAVWASQVEAEVASP